ncbi:anaerobic ribonucleoside-triphosphate reductase [Flexistipes sinusarabici DSM 4947]|uniref:Anaerobic ribonucleoside-triphosphate reductase n=1 Tax=Flexistipes sinusarabici (strain ATCC 49648 / DSM 4947 / MAS 10) TaxID=717231 RepID=F8E4G1_FLESM|nr:ribonucleoside triphosphate reductase [Flexistipes sinusarabici]AEI14447.1 anaerobic ribonucleoside-triphosphate reductase [Flexistipes sinusarabici DSM 4947]
MNLEKIIKRDGRVVPFDYERIANAIFKAAKAVGGEDRKTANKLALQTVKFVNEKYAEIGVITVEELQDEVEKILIEEGHAKTAKAYILYRKQRSDIRDLKASFDEMEQLIENYIKGADWRVKENSNTTFSLQGLNNFISSTITAKYWLNKVYPAEIREAHTKGDFHIHDLGLLSVYCCGWDLRDLLLKGFRGVHGKVESKPPKHFRSALGQIVNFFYTLQGEAAGAQALASFDTYLAPYVKFDKLTYKEVKQGIQEFIFNLNVPTRVGFQTPFTNLTFDLEVPSMMKNESVVYGGKLIENTYGEFQNEMDLINKAFIEVMAEGDAKGRIFTFPIPTYNISKDFDWDREILDDLMKMTGKYGLPYFANFVNSDMDPEDARSMCCRLRLDNRQLRKRGGGLFGANPLTGSIGVVTINLPRLGYTSDSEDDFFSNLEKLMETARNSLNIKRKTLEKLTEENLYPYAKYYLSDIKERFGEYWSNHFNTIGIIGMNEALMNFIGVDITHDEGLEFTDKMMNFMNEKMQEFQDEDDILFNLEATPAEGTSYRLAQKDKEEYPDIITAGTSKPYYTNSTQLPVNCKLDLFKALNHQDKLQTKYTGGTVFHIFVGESVDDTSSVKELIRKVSNGYKLPYFTITPTFSICPVHGYIKGEYGNCPLCRQEAQEKLMKELKELQMHVASAESR